MLLVTANEMREMDQRTIENFGIPGRVLMETAGRGATAFLQSHFHGPDLRCVGIMAGRGNNGGDGFVMARCLADQGYAVHVFLLSERKRVAGDAAANLALLDPMQVPVIELPDETTFFRHKGLMDQQTLWIDAILGTGLNAPVRGYYRTVIDFINSSGRPVFAVDIPSGLNTDNGRPMGSCVQADATATFAYAKTGHMIQPGTDLTGVLKVVDIGIPAHIVREINPRQFLVTPDQLCSDLPVRQSQAHKGDTGHLLLVAGSTGKTGAAALAAVAAMRVGAGLVSLGLPASLNPIAEVQLLESMTIPLPEVAPGTLGENAVADILTLMTGKRCLAIGPGLGTADATQRLVQKVLLKSPVPVVIDADGLNCLASHVGLLREMAAPAVLTPHPGEMARLTDTSTAHVQEDRMAVARTFATRFGVYVVLKGARTVIAEPTGEIYINPTGNAGMASGGMGDVLTGLIAGLIVQGVPPGPAARLGAFLHGMAADTLVAQKGPFGYLASEVMHTIPEMIQRLLQEAPPPEEMPQTG